MTECLTLSIQNAAEILGISTSLCYQLARKGSLPGVMKFGSRYVISKYQLENYINNAGTRPTARENKGDAR